MSREEIAVEMKEWLLRKYGRLIKSVKEIPEGLEVDAVNGRYVHLDMSHEGHVVMKGFENDGELVVTKSEWTGGMAWMGLLMYEVAKVLKGRDEREASIAARVAGTSAEEEYRVTKRQVDHLLRDLMFNLERHAKRQSQNPTNWAYAGDLGHVAEELKHLGSFLGP